MESVDDNSTTEPVKSTGPVRTCAGCQKRVSADELVRVVLDPSSQEIAVDLSGSAFGRGAHVHGTTECLAKALKGGFARVFKTKVVADAKVIGAQIVSAADRRIEGLLQGARRAKQIAVGADVVVESLREGKAELVVVARDAAAAARLGEVERAIASGKAIAFSEKKRLGALFARDEVAVCAVLHSGVAAAIAATYRVSRPFMDGDAHERESGGDAWFRPSPEAR
jgi:predicted RNA-binding protein YlxR (DUF448 family)/ribosomal protein L30E